MNWFGLFDRLRLHGAAGNGMERHDPGSTAGWSLPGSQLRVTDRALASLYRGLTLAAGKDFRADMFDLAGHYLARVPKAAAGQFHLDARLTGRAQRLLFGEDPGHGLIAWHEPSLTATVRLPGGDNPAGVTLPHSRLPLLLAETLPINALSSFTAWVETAEQAAALLQGLAPWLTQETCAVLRMNDAQAARLLPALPRSPASCAAVIPCTGAADHEGRGEDPVDLLICLENLSPQTCANAAARMAAARVVLSRPSWNDQERDLRIQRQGGVAVQLPLPDRALTPSWTLGVVEETPATPVGQAMAALQATPYRAASGFDYVAEISGARLLTADGVVVVLPQDGPVLVDPSQLPEADALSAAPAQADMLRLLGAHGLLAEGAFAALRPGPVRHLSDRPAFLLGGAATAPRYLTEIWPRMEHLLRQCEQERLEPEDFDVLVPGGANRLTRDSLAVLGIPDSAIHESVDGVLYRRLLVAPPASRGDAAQRTSAYDQFWTRLDGLRGGEVASFSAPRPAERLWLTGDGAGPLNAPSLAAAVRARGFRIIALREHDLPGLMTLLGGARMLIGDAQSLAWSVLARECAVGVLLSESMTDLPHAVLHAAAARRHALSVAFGTAIGGPEGGFAVAPDVLNTLIDRLERVSARDAAGVGAVR